MIHLREYLKAARRREGHERMLSGGNDIISPQIEQVAERLRERGIKVEIGRGLSNFKIDMALTLPEFGDKYLVAVLFDGEEWSERPLAIDRDALPIMVLEGVMSWRRVARVWMPSLRLELDSVIDELVEHVHVAKDMPDPTPPPPPPITPRAASDDNDVEAKPGKEPKKAANPAAELRSASPVDEVLPNQEPFTPFQFPLVRYGPDALLTTFAQGLLEQLVDSEGPMPAATAIKRVAYEFGLQRVRDSKIGELVPLLSTRRVTEVIGGHFVWPHGLEPDLWRAFRKTMKEQRKLDEISPYEIVNAMEVTVRRSITISPYELVRWTGDFFGAGRITEKVTDYLSACIEWAVSTKRFHLEEGLLTRGD